MDKEPELEAWQQEIHEFALKYLIPAIEQAAEDGANIDKAIYGLFWTASMILIREDKETALPEFEDYVRRYLSDWHTKEDKETTH